MRVQLQAVSLRMQALRSNEQMAVAMKGATRVSASGERKVGGENRDGGQPNGRGASDGLGGEQREVSAVQRYSGNQELNVSSPLAVDTIARYTGVG